MENKNENNKHDEPIMATDGDKHNTFSEPTNNSEHLAPVHSPDDQGRDAVGDHSNSKALDNPQATMTADQNDINNVGNPTEGPQHNDFVDEHVQGTEAVQSLVLSSPSSATNNDPDHDHVAASDEPIAASDQEMPTVAQGEEDTAVAEGQEDDHGVEMEDRNEGGEEESEDAEPVSTYL